HGPGGDPLHLPPAPPDPGAVGGCGQGLRPASPQRGRAFRAGPRPARAGRRGFALFRSGSTATASTSMSRSGRTNWEISIRVLAGRLAPKYSLRNELILSRYTQF